MRNGFGLWLVFCVASACLRADVVECENGDRFNGNVLSVDAETVKLRNDIAGVLTIPRSRVTSISFRAVRPKAAVSGASTNLSALSPDQALKFDPAAIQKVQNEILGGAGPEATQIFQEMLGGLMSGKLDVSDVRAKAQESLVQLKKLQKELGDDDAAAMLGSYGAILESFLKESAPPVAKTNSPASASGAKSN